MQKEYHFQISTTDFSLSKRKCRKSIQTAYNIKLMLYVYVVMHKNVQGFVSLPILETLLVSIYRQLIES